MAKDPEVMRAQAAAARIRTQGTLDGLTLAREMTALEAKQEFIDGHAKSAEALRQLYLKFHQRVKDYQQALEADTLESGSGI